MFWEALTLGLVILSIISFFAYRYLYRKEGYIAGDTIEVKKALMQLHTQLAHGKEPSSICDADFHKLKKNIALAQIALGDMEIAELEKNKEGYYPFEKKKETQEAPEYPDYSFPAYPPATLKGLYYSGLPIGKLYTKLPPNLYNRMNFWYPGFNTSSWSWWFRPGMKTGFQSFWIKNNGNYFYIQN
jgi:hypothetical protein